MFLDRVKNRLRKPELREFFWFCLPALLVGALLRVILMADMPFGFYQPDSPDLLDTPDELIQKGRFDLHPKKTFLVPAIYTAALVAPPMLKSIVIFQHLLGLIMIVLTGALCRFWFVHWKWFIVPVTMLIAIHPSILWFEHTLMAEAIFLNCVVFTAFAGTVFAMRKSNASFVLLCVSLVLLAGARPEGKLFFGFGLLLIGLMFWKQWKHMGILAAALLAVAIPVHFLTKTSQAGLLLYTSVVHLTPAELKSAPGFEPYISPLRTKALEEWAVHPRFPKSSERNEVARAVQTYLSEHKELGLEPSKQNVNSFCLKLAMETCRRNLMRLPKHVLHKFRKTALSLPSENYSREMLIEKQTEEFAGGELPLRLSKRLTGMEMKTAEELSSFITENYHPERVSWFNELDRKWRNWTTRWRLPDTKYAGYVEPGVPFYFLAGLAGLIASILLPGPFQRLHIALGGTLAAVLFIIVLTANVKARFRFFLEPFWILYAAMLVQVLILLGLLVWRKIAEKKQA